MASATTMPSLSSRMRTSDSVRDMDFDIARADLMTPFSLTLAAEKAIESAKRQLDAMDERLLRARMSMANARRQAGDRRVSDPAEVDQAARGWSEPQLPEYQKPVSDSLRISRHDQKNDGPDAGESTDIERKTVEMKKLRDDLRDLRSRMNQSRSMGDALKLTPPRPRRPSAAEIPDFAELEKSLHEHRFDLSAFPVPPGMASDATRPFSSSSSMEADADLPVIVPQQENPFSPRPYSSLSILEPLSPKPYPESTLKPFPKSSIPTFGSLGRRRPPSQQQQQQQQPRLSRTSSAPRKPFADWPRQVSDQSHRRSSGSDTGEYSDPDTSIGTRTPSATSPSRSAGSSLPLASNPKSKLTGHECKMSPKGTRISQDSLRSDTDHQDLLVRVEQLLSRISLLDTGTEEERRRRRKLQAALAILEDSEEE